MMCVETDFAISSPENAKSVKSSIGMVIFMKSLLSVNSLARWAVLFHLVFLAWLRNAKISARLDYGVGKRQGCKAAGYFAAGELDMPRDLGARQGAGLLQCHVLSACHVHRSIVRPLDWSIFLTPQASEAEAV